MARKPTLSPTRITTFLACPLLYRWTYVHPQPYLRKAKSYFSFGTSLHRVLEKYHADPDRGVDPTQKLMDLYEENWLTAGYSSADEMAEAFGEGKEILQDYAAQEEEAAVTGEFTIAIEKSLRMDMGEFVLLGRIDRLDQHPDGTLEIIDYKSRRTAVSEEEVKSDLAMGCYQLMIRPLYPDHRIVASIWALKGREKASASLSSEEADELVFELGEIGREILNKDWESAEPRYKAMCRKCDYCRLCRRDGDFNDDWKADGVEQL